jgi:hypothetical protein
MTTLGEAYSLCNEIVRGWESVLAEQEDDRTATFFLAHYEAMRARLKGMLDMYSPNTLFSSLPPAQWADILTYDSETGGTRISRPEDR